MLYTRGGDKGKTNLWNKKISKHDPQIEALGDLDELNSHIGLCRAQNQDKNIDAILLAVQDALHRILAEVSGMIDAKPLEEEKTKELERWTDNFEKEIGPITKFILPGGTTIAAQIDIARTVCRRAERHIIALNEKKPQNHFLISYLNRLSSLLFALARIINKRAGHTEINPQYR